jgi:16S rRNA processing protein RimM
MSTDSQDEFVIVGKFGASYGVKGWIKVFSDTDPKDAILDYEPWFIETNSGQWEEIKISEARFHSKCVIAHIEGCNAKEETPAYTNKLMAVKQSQLAKLDNDQFYWSELKDMQVMNTEDIVLGKVDHLFEAGANDILVVKGERKHLIPFIWKEFIKSVDRETKTIIVDWDSEF